MRLIWLALIAALLAGCGAGGGSTVTSAVQPGGVVVELSTRAGSAATVLYAVEFTLHLPAGVTLPADSSSGEVPAAVLHAADSAALAGARYQPATAGAQALVKVNIVDPGGFTVGALATMNCTVAPGAVFDGSGFSLDGFSARDASGVAIPGVTPHLTVQLQ